MLHVVQKENSIWKVILESFCEVEGEWILMDGPTIDAKALKHCMLW